MTMPKVFMRRPTVSIVMPVYNAESYLHASLKSLMGQTYKDFECIIIDDCSRDSSLRTVQSFHDNRIYLYRNKHHQGVAASLNKALRFSRARQYIARMDADDIAYPNRLHEQVKYLDRNPSIGVVGTWARLIDKYNRETGSLCFDQDDSLIKENLFRRNSLIHPSVMVRRDLFNLYGGYDENLNGAEDYDLWLRFACVTKFHNIGKYLLKYRRSLESVSYRQLKKIEWVSIKARVKAIKEYGYPWRNSLYLIGNVGSALLPRLFKLMIYRHYYRYR